jgi:hypothetical protein
MSGRHKKGMVNPSATPAQVSTIRAAAAHACPATMEELEGRQLLSTYYVSSSGSDSASGTSSSSPWRTISRVNKQSLHSGDKVLFKGGNSFSGGIYLPSSEGGVTISTYGSGKATINSGSSRGIDIAQTAGVHISNLNIVGNGMYNNSSSGIHLHIDWGNVDKSGFYVNNVEVRGYGHHGIEIYANGNRGSSLSNVSITNCQLHDNKWGGLKATADHHNNNKNWTISHVAAYNSPGDSGRGDVTGNGIFVADVDGALIDHYRAFNNGQHGAAPVGIWSAGSNRVTIQYCESYNNHSRSISDGGGFDFDWDTNNSVMQYNYSHGNDGPGYLLGAGSHGSDSNVIRYNITENDGRRNGRAGIQFWGNVTNAKVYNNTVFISYTGNSNTAAFFAHDSGSGGKEPRNCQIVNNIFTTTNGAKVINLWSGPANAGGIKFAGNDYYTYGGSFHLQYGNNSYSSLSSWRSAKGQEKVNGAATGYQGDPKLNSAGHGGTVGNTNYLGSLWAYKLQSSSPLVNRGTSQPSFLSSVVKTDFYGGSSLLGGHYDIGADECR